MKRLVLLGVFVCSLLVIHAQQTNAYRYSLNLEEVVEDQLQVSLLVPKIEQSGPLLYRFPRIVPGTYDVYDFGQYINKLQAFDNKGQEISVMRTDKNTWTISETNNLHRISYWVNDTWDATDVEEFVFEPGGTNIEAGKNFVLNTHGFFGYFEGHTNLPFQITVQRPPGLYGSTGILKVESDKHTDTFYLNDYNELVDSPIMYCEPETTFVNVGETRVLVSVYSPSKKVSAQTIADNIQTTLFAIQNYLGGKLPVEKYAFIIYLYEGMSLSGGAGALEHANSSFYYLPEMEPKQLAKIVTDVAAHEFFHIVTPLTVHSEEIRYFDFYRPTMSKHLWLYEGVTEYFANHVQVYEKMIEPEEYLSVLQAKMKGADAFRQDISFTELSTGTLDKHKKEYSNVYQKGALIGMCLDILLRDLSEGNMGLKDLLAKLAEKYGKNKPFKDEELFDVIEKISYPEVGNFLRTYVEQANPLPLQEIFAKAGIEYIGKATAMEPSLGNVAFGFNYETNRLVVMDVSNADAMGKKLGFKVGDEIISLNQVQLLPENLERTVTQYKKKTKPGETVTFVIARPGKKGYKNITRKAKVIFNEQQVKHLLSFNERSSTKQLSTRNAWLNIK